MLNVLTLLAIVLVAMPAFYLLAAIISVVRFRRHLRDAAMNSDTPISVLKPLCGDEVDLEQNLRSFCVQDYENFQIIFGVRDPQDPATEIVNRIIAQFPERDISLVADERVLGSNLKISNLANMMPLAKHDILVIADSDMWVGPEYLKTVAAPFVSADVGAATCLYSGSARGGVLSKLGAMFINDWFFPSALIPAMHGELSFCFGATMAVRRDALAAFGGFEALADVLADDYMLGNHVARQGLKIALIPYVVKNIVHEPNLKALFRHEVRWARTIRNVKPFGYALSVITEALPLSIIAGLLFYFANWPLWMAMLPIVVLFALRLTLHLAVCRTIKGREECAPLLIPLRDLLSVCVRITAYLGSTVHWREQVLTVRANSCLQDAS